MTDAAKPSPKPRAARAKGEQAAAVIDTSKTAAVDPAEIDHKPQRARSPDEIRLGETRVDFASGFVGLVIARIDMFSGNVQFGLQPRGGGDTIPEAQFIDYHMLSKVDDGIADSLPPIDTSVTIKIGEEVEDIVSGVKGIVVERVIFQNGCVYFAAQPPASKKTPNVLPEVIRYPHKRLRSIGRGLLPKPEKVKVEKPAETKPTARGPGGPSRGAKSMRMA